MFSDFAVLRQMLRGEPRSDDPRERLEGFYRPQAAAYDRFREKLLRGRRELVESLTIGDGARLVELGGGTGRNLEFFADRLPRFAEVTLVDLCPALLEQADERCRRQGWSNVRCVEADAAHFQPRGEVDCVLLSYCLTMIPDWFAVVDNAFAMLRPGGLIGVVDFYIARKFPAPGFARHNGFTRHFWPLWFAHDGVHPSADHLPYLSNRCLPVAICESAAPMPYLCGLRAPYYRFIGRKAS